MAYTVVWFKRDLRVHDHAPLVHAARQGPVLCLYVLEPSLWAQPDCALQHFGFLRESLRDLALQLRTCGATLQLAVGEVPEVLAHLHALQPFARLASHEETGNAHTYARDLAVARWCRQHCVGWQVKMLHPLEVLQRAEGAWRSGQAPLAAVEGFVRQILGWREYVRGIYWAHMPGYDAHNALGHHQPLPHWFWSGDTRMRCLHLAITQSLQTAHAHHIQRLMVIGNFALLAGLEPQALHRWYLGIYIDAFEWVELPNTLGMSQRADGGLIATKPYVSSAAYLQRMGDYCQGCAYDPKQKTGARACPFNALYWDFFERHAPMLQGNPRLALVYRQLQKMSDAQRAALRTQAGHLRERLDTL